MTRACLLIAVAGCTSTPPAGASDASIPDVGANGTVVVPPDGHRPNFTCATQPAPSVADDPITLSGAVETIAMNGTLQPVDAAEVALFRAGQPVVLSRMNSDAAGAFSTGALASGGHPLKAYLKATKPGFRTTFFFPQYPFWTSLTPERVPMISDALFATVTGMLGATQHDGTNGALLVVVADCDGTPLTGATITVTHGNAPAGHIYDLATIIPGAAATFLVLDVPDGKVRVTATNGSTPFPDHDIIVRAKDPDCPSARGTLTATTMMPGL
jgi:hypothetical protein